MPTCVRCGHESPTPRASCPACRSWGTFERWRRLVDVAAAEAPRRTSGLAVVDWLVGGTGREGRDDPGWVEGCVYGLAAEPGTGKSTLALSLVSTWPDGAYLTDEETPGAVRLRAERIGVDASPILLGEIRRAEEIDELPASVRFVVVDSLSELHSPDVSGGPGTNGQMIHAIRTIRAWARARRGVAVVVQQVNGEGDAAGPMQVAHAVDCSIWAAREGETSPRFKLWTVKNRHGPLRTIYATHTERGLEYARPDDDDDRPVHAAPARDHVERSDDRAGTRGPVDARGGPDDREPVRHDGLDGGADGRPRRAPRRAAPR